MRKTIRALAVFALSGVTVVSCTLGLDESKIGALPDGGNPDGSVTSDASVDGAIDASVAEKDAGLVACTKDEECLGADGCLKPRCDLERGTCVFDVCKTPVCNTAACDVGARTCGAPKAHPFRAGLIPIAVAPFCPVARSCLAAVHPYVFALTASGPVAYGVADPANGSPKPIPITGLGFFPTIAVASGNRVYFATNSVGGTPSRIPIAWIDVPSNPFVDKLAASSALAISSRPGGETFAMFPRAKNGALLFVNNAGVSYPAAIVEGALGEPVTVTPTVMPLTAGTAPAAMSGSRLLTSGFAPTGIPSFGFILNAGTATPQLKDEAPLPTAGIVNPPQAFSQTAGGAVFWTAAALTAAPPAGTVRAARGFFLVADDKSAPDGAQGVDLEVYAAIPNGTVVAGPSAMLDGKTALAVAAATGALDKNSTVQFVQREPLGLVKGANNQPKRDILPVPVAQVLAASASNGIGYVFTQESATASAIYVYEPGCAP